MNAYVDEATGYLVIDELSAGVWLMKPEIYQRWKQTMAAQAKTIEKQAETIESYKAKNSKKQTNFKKMIITSLLFPVIMIK